MGKLIFLIGFVAMLASFAVALRKYFKLERMDLTVMFFMLSIALMVSGITVSVLGGEFDKTDPEALARAAEEAEAQQRREERFSNAPTMYVSWDETIYPSSGSTPTAGTPAEEQPAAEAEGGEAPEAPASEPEQPAVSQ